MIFNVCCSSSSSYNNENNANIIPTSVVKKTRGIPKMDVIKIHEHIESFHPAVAHYRHEHTAKRRYLSSEITASFMHADYLEKYLDHKCSYDFYRKKKSKHIIC